MANEDSFINEVTEEVRRDKLFALFRRYGPYAALAIILFVGGAAFNEYRKAQAEAEAQAIGDNIIAALEQDEASARAEAMSELLQTQEPSAKSAVLGLMNASVLAEGGDVEGALAAYAVVAGSEVAPKVYRDIATLKSAILGAGTVHPEQRIAQLASITVPGNSFRVLGLEQRALAEMEMGETTRALETLQGIMVDAEATDDLRNRAAQLIVALGGTPVVRG